MYVHVYVCKYIYICICICIYIYIYVYTCTYMYMTYLTVYGGSNCLPIAVMPMSALVCLLRCPCLLP